MLRVKKIPRHLQGRGLISAKAKKAFAKKAGHNPPKPTYAEEAETAESVVETVSRPVAAAATRVKQLIGGSKKARGATTLGIRG